MKIFEHKFENKKFHRKTLRMYAYYRRSSLISDNCTLEHLINFHRYESLGILPDGVSVHEYRNTNGFANGKWAAQVTIDTAKEDILNGYFCKYDFYKGVRGWFWKICLENLVLPITPTFFPYENLVLPFPQTFFPYKNE